MAATVQAVPVSESSLRNIAYVQEANWGVAPGAGGVAKWMVSESLKQNTQFIASQRIRGDRQVPDQVRTQFSAGGDLVDEWSYTEQQELLSGLLGNDWAANVLTNGLLFKSYAISVQDASLTSTFKRYLGMAVAGMQREIVVGAVNRVTWSFLGKAEESGTAHVGGATPAAATSTQVQNSVDHISAVLEGGAATTQKVRRLTINVNPNLRERLAIGELGAFGIGLGTFDITGEIEFYMRDVAMIDKYLNWTLTDIGWTETDDAGNSETWLVPAVRFVDGDRITQGRDTDVMVRLNYAAMIDAGGTEKMIQVTRTPAI